MEFKDYYKVMGVEPGASAEDIKRAYRRLARKYHPDVSDQPDAEDRFKEIGEAYEVLRDPEKRKRYDELRARGFRGGEEFRPPPDWQEFEFSGFGDRGGFGFDSAEGFSDFFETLFGRARRAGASRARTRRGRDLHATAEVDLETAYSGGVRRITLNRPEIGPDGTVRHSSQSLDVRIPAGVRDGHQIRLKGKGEPAPGGGPPGDLYLDIRLMPHHLFEVDGKDVLLTLPVAPWEAALGTRVSVPTLGGRVEMAIPPGSSSGKRMRLKGRGLPGRPPGDQYVILRVVVPPAQTAEQKRLYRALSEAFDFNPRASLEAGA